MTVTWTSGYGMDEAVPVVEWGLQGGKGTISPAGTLTFDRGSMCGECEFFSSPFLGAELIQVIDILFRLHVIY